MQPALGLMERHLRTIAKHLPKSDTLPEPYRSQFGEDWVLDEFFGHRTSGFYVEVGAYNGVDISNTYFFEKRGWGGVLIEASPPVAAECRRNRPGSRVVNCAVVGPGGPPEIEFNIVQDSQSLSRIQIGAGDPNLNLVRNFTGRLDVRPVRVPARTLDSILEEECGSRAIDFMTIDVEGYEYEVLRGFTIERWRPTVLIVERAKLLPESRIMRHLHRNGYRYECTTGVNDWFVVRGGAGIADSLRYRARLLAQLYAPKRAQQVVSSARGTARMILAGLGLLPLVQRLRGQHAAAPAAKPNRAAEIPARGL
jgi:FkbM family methyltransferase